MPKVNQQDLEMAFEWVSSGYGNEAFVSRTSGEIYWASEDGATDLEAELPDDIGDPDRYLLVPSKRELDLGSHLAMNFVLGALPSEVQEVRQIFRRKGAYGRFKALLERKGMLQQWHDYEDQREREALEQWCKDNELELTST